MTLFILAMLVQQKVHSQKIGLVLSGGGGAGLAHVGVLKALEENNIPIDYIAGTSIGALIAGLYAAGYSPLELQQMVLSENFQKWAEGENNKKLSYFIKESEATPGIISIKFELDSLETNLPTSFINSAPIDFGLLSGLAPANAAAEENFDSLMIPFRCVAANISKSHQQVFSKGDLATSIRASMAYPFYLTPIKIDGDLMFDGGLYNNFPADVLCEEFNVDFLIGSNVSSNFEAPTEDNLISQLRSMLSKETDYVLPCAKGIIIKPEIIEMGVFDFSNSREVVDSGYYKTIHMIDSIHQLIDLSERKNNVHEKRLKFKEKWVKLIFEDAVVKGIHPRQSKYIINEARKNEGTFDERDLEKIYMKLISDEQIKSIYPTASYNKEKNNFDLLLDIKKEKSFSASFGGVLSTKPINTGFFEMKYQTLGATGLSLSGNSFFGKLYSSASAKAKWEVPFSLPFYLQGKYTINHFDYFNSFSTLVEDIKPSYLIISENYEEISINLPVFLKGKIGIGQTRFNQEYEYYQTKDFERSDTADLTSFKGFSTFLGYERNSLNRKQYASKGSHFELIYRFTRGNEISIPGSTSARKGVFEKEHDWFSLKIKYEKYFFQDYDFKIGLLMETQFSDQSFFNNYTATVLSAPAFQPLPESKTLFQDQYRAMQYIGSGVKAIYSLNKNIDIRLEAYMFQPYEELIPSTLQTASEGTEISVRDIIASFNTVYHTAIGPLAFSVNYYEHTEDPYSLLLHFGYIIFNKKSFE